MSSVEDTCLEMSLRNSMGGKMDFMTKSGYNLFIWNTTVMQLMLRLLLGQGVFLG